MKTLRIILRPLAMLAFLLAVAGCTISYKLNGAAIDYNVYKTIYVSQFPIRAALVYPPLQQTFENELLASISRMVNVFPPHKRTYPLLIGCGEHDIPTEITAVKMWKQDEPEAYMVILKDAGHCVNMDVPQAFNQLMHQFWQSAL